MMEIDIDSEAPISNQKSGASLSSSLLDEITCAICLDIYEEPKRTSCLHVACRRCLEEYHHSCKNDMDVATCPQCRAPSIHLLNGDASSLPPAIDKEQLIKIYRQEQDTTSRNIGLCDLCSNESANLHGRCFQCQENYCRACFAHHAHFHPSPSHIARTFDEIRHLPTAPAQLDENTPFNCAQRHHRRPLEFYCMKCAECLCAECLIDESAAHHRHHSHTIRLLSQVAQDHRYQLQRLHSNKLKTINRELNEAIESIGSMLDKDRRLILVLEQLQIQSQRGDELDRLMETLINHAHDIHVIMYEKQAREQLMIILNQRPPRPRQGYVLSGLRFERVTNLKNIIKIILPMEILPTINDPTTQYVEHVYLDFVSTSQKSYQQPIIGYQVSYEQSESTLLRLFGSFLPQQVKPLTCTIYSYSNINRQFVKEDTAQLLFNFPKRYDLEMKHNQQDIVSWMDEDDMWIVYERKSDCLTIKHSGLLQALSSMEKKKEHFLGYRLMSMQIRLIPKKQQLLVCGLKLTDQDQPQLPVCILYDLKSLQELSVFHCHIKQNMRRVLDVVLYDDDGDEDQNICLCLESTDRRLFMWLPTQDEQQIEEIGFSGIPLQEDRTIIDRLAISRHLDVLIAYRNIEQDETRTCFAVSKYLIPICEN